MMFLQYIYLIYPDCQRTCKTIPNSRIGTCNINQSYMPPLVLTLVAFMLLLYNTWKNSLHHIRNREMAISWNLTCRFTLKMKLSWDAATFLCKFSNFIILSMNFSVLLYYLDAFRVKYICFNRLSRKGFDIHGAWMSWILHKFFQ